MKRMLKQNKKIAKILSQITKIQKEYSDKQIAIILEDVKKIRWINVTLIKIKKKKCPLNIKGVYQMAFEGLSNRLQEITRKMRGKARITESDLKEMLREVKLALLEADVNYKIVKGFINTIQEKALGQDVLKSLTPGQQVVKIVKDELVELLGGVESKSKLYTKSSNNNNASRSTRFRKNNNSRKTSKLI